MTFYPPCNLNVNLEDKLYFEAGKCDDRMKHEKISKICEKYHLFSSRIFSAISNKTIVYVNVR